MLKFKPFKGIRANNDIVRQFVIHPIDSYEQEEIQELINKEPFSFLQIVKPTWEDDQLTSNQRFKKVRSNFDDYFKHGVLKQDTASFYIYQQKIGSTQIHGILGLVSIDDFKEKRIKKHEETLEERKQLFANYIKEVEVYAEPVLLTHKSNQRLEIIISLEVKKKATYQFTDNQGVEHSLWQVKNRLNLKQIKDSVESLDALYIADGHHRMGSSEIYTDYKREQNKNHLPTAAFNFTMALLVPENDLIVKDYNRMVKDLNGYSKEEFLTLLEEKFIVTEKGEKPYFPSKKHHISMYLDGEFYGLYIKHEFRGKPEGLGELDTYLFEQNILKPILNIHNTRQDKRIGFAAGTRDLKGINLIKKKVDAGKFRAGFGFYPISTKDLRLVSDLELKMPPKSTNIQPKLLSGLVFLDLKS